MHIAAVLDPKLKNQRIFAWGCYRDWNNALDAFNTMYREKNSRPGKWNRIVDEGPPSTKLETDVMPVYDILRRWSRRSGWQPFEGTLFDSVNMYREMGYKGLDAK